MRFLAAIVALLFALPAQAQNMQRALVVSSCGAQTLAAGPLTNLTMNPAGQLCLAGIGGGTSPPTNSVAPVASGSLVNGSLLTTTNGTWSGSPTFTYQWQRNAVNIAGATANTYTTVPADGGTAVGAQVTGTNGGGSVPALSNTLAILPPPPVNSVAPVASGSLTIGSLLTTTNGTWTNSPTGFTYQWQRNAATIAGATAQTYTTVTADGGKAVGANVTATNTGGSNSALSNTLAIAAPPGNMATPVLASVGAPPPSGTFAVNFFGGVFNSLSTRNGPTSIPGVISGMTVRTPTAITTNEFTFTLMKNGTATALVCSVGVGGVNVGTTTTCSDPTDTVTVAVGDLLAWQTTIPGGTPTTIVGNTGISVLFTSSNGQESLLGGAYDNFLSTVAITYLSPSNNTVQSTDVLASAVMPTTGTLDLLNISLSGVPGSGKQFQFILFKNGVATALVATCSLATTCSDTTDVVSFAPGDTFSLQVCPGGVGGCAGTANATSTAMEYSMRFKPVTANQAVLFGTLNLLNTNSTMYSAVYAAGTAVTVETQQQNPAPILPATMTLGNLYVAQCPGSGAAITRSIILRDNSVSQAPVANLPAGTVACPTMTTGQDTTHTYQAATSSVLNYLIQSSATAVATPTTKMGMTVTVP